MDKILEIKEELGTMHVTLRNGQKIPVKAKTIITCWESGRQDCKVEIEKPIPLSGIKES